MADSQTRLQALQEWQKDARQWHRDNPNPPAGHSFLCRANCDHVRAPDGSTAQGKKGN